MLTRSVLKSMWPRAMPAKIDAIARIAPRVFEKYGFVEELDVPHFMAQISHENGGGTIARENLNYRTEAQLLKIFGAKQYAVQYGGRGHSAALTPDQARSLIGHPQELAERVYGLGNPKKAKELGNKRAGDGYRFRGGGDLQLTGGANYERIGTLTGFDLYGNPDQLNDPAISFDVAVAEFVKLNCLPAARDDDCDLVTKRVNGGYNGLAERKVWLRKWKAALAPAEDDDDNRVGVVEAEVPPPEEPRAGESDQPPSNFGVIAARAGGGAIGVATAAANLVGPVTDTVESVRTVTDNAGAIVATTKEIVKVAPRGLWQNTIDFMQTPRFLVCVIGGICLAWGISWYLRSHRKEVR